MSTLTIHTLECIKTEDWTGADTCRLEIGVDGGKPTAFKKNLNNGQSWELEKTVQFDRLINIRLWDED